MIAWTFEHPYLSTLILLVAMETISTVVGYITGRYEDE